MAGAERDETSFAAAVDGARLGGVDGLTTLFRAYHPRVLRYLRSREPRLADDIAGETWLAVAAQIQSFHGDDVAFSAWIFTIARQRLADHRRTGARRRTDPSEEVEEQHGHSASSEQLGVEHLSAQAAVDFIVTTLSDDQAEVVLLRTLGDLSAKEVARILDRDEGWVRVTHHRALNRLRGRVRDTFL